MPRPLSLHSFGVLRTLRQAQKRQAHTKPTPIPQNSHVYAIPSPEKPSEYVLTLLPTIPPNPLLALGTTSALPPGPSTFTLNPAFSPILSATVREYGATDPDTAVAASVYAASSQSSAFLARGSGTGHKKTKTVDDKGREAGSGVRGGFVHITDRRAEPEFGRVPDPEDILGSVEVDGEGNVIGDHVEDSGTYRVVTRRGVLGLSPYLREKLVERLKKLEAEEQG
ncbi:hypothetical protein EJ06DRAFT_59812 [Trichodelitschia bisporula]|uniref:Uncharacterized protein n=1 Tax=Trichodelitschia bisporula TaxID=703511 RepID=A0A6G1HUC5_9PEZI|nr:hypothetical protein EJ06DRAFT_59812 [Trichodelitschia bisporula]